MMRIPKFKHWFMAMSPEDYDRFCETRSITATAEVSIDLVSGQVSHAQPRTLQTSVPAADTYFRRATGALGLVYVLRIPSNQVPREAVRALSATVYELRAPVHVPHCGVESVELAQ
jgi:hypothetical protein